MSGLISVSVTALVVAILLWQDGRRKPQASAALWIPLIWVLISGSRFVSQWLNLGPIGGVDAIEDGSPIDRAIFAILIAAGVAILIRRRVGLFDVINKNRWVALYLLYCCLAIFWSDVPFVAFKRWIKAIGEPIMVLVVLSDPQDRDAIVRLIRRCGYLLIPFSITLIRYFPQYGRAYGRSTGFVEYTGVTRGKNALGYLCMVVAGFVFADLLQTFKDVKGAARRNQLLVSVAILSMTWYLLWIAKSSTAMVGAAVIMIGMVALTSSLVNRRFLTAYIVAGVVVIFLADVTVGVFDRIIAMLGEDSTLTGRTELWQELFGMDFNRWVGAGFESFWLGERLERLWAEHWWRPNEAHNGYIETYLNLGAIGLTLLVGMIVATYRKARRDLLSDFNRGRTRMAFLLAIVIYNWTEAGYRGLHLVMFAFYLIAIDYAQPAARAASKSDTALPVVHVYTPSRRGRQIA